MPEEHKPIREGHANTVNPNELGLENPAHDRKAQQKPDIKESEIGRESSQIPADEHIEPRLSQIDPGTVKLQQQKEDKELGEPMESDSAEAEGRDDAGYNNPNGDFDEK